MSSAASPYTPTSTSLDGPPNTVFIETGRQEWLRVQSHNTTHIAHTTNTTTPNRCNAL
eukprot:m.77396 g.77396  ORF g.77396 m.77396 type:complete len:58 (-) comp11915_c0_seq4:1411-1584(-)